MKIISLILVFILFCTAVVVSQQWQELNGEHFIVYYLQNENFAKEISRKSEVYYRNIAKDLGYPRYSEFWLWDKRVKIYIYPDHTSYLKATGQPSWSHGMADYTNKQIVSYVWGKDFAVSILPHEIAHLIFRDFIGFKGEAPLWLDEGVAQWEEEAKRKYFKTMIKKSYDEDILLSLEEMMKLDIKKLKDKRIYIRSAVKKDGKESVLFLDREGIINAYYLQAVSLVGFLIERYGSDRFACFCRQLRDGKTLNGALKFTYPEHIRNLSELEDKWKEYIKQIKYEPITEAKYKTYRDIGR